MVHEWNTIVYAIVRESMVSRSRAGLTLPWYLYIQLQVPPSSGQTVSASSTIGFGINSSGGGGRGHMRMQTASSNLPAMTSWPRKTLIVTRHNNIEVTPDTWRNTYSCIAAEQDTRWRGRVQWQDRDLDKKNSYSGSKHTVHLEANHG